MLEETVVRGYSPVLGQGNRGDRQVLKAVTNPRPSQRGTCFRVSLSCRPREWSHFYTPSQDIFEARQKVCLPVTLGQDHYPIVELGHSDSGSGEDAKAPHFLDLSPYRGPLFHKVAHGGCVEQVAQARTAALELSASSPYVLPHLLGVFPGQGSKEFQRSSSSTRERT